MTSLIATLALTNCLHEQVHQTNSVSDVSALGKFVARKLDFFAACNFSMKIHKGSECSKFPDFILTI